MIIFNSLLLEPAGERANEERGGGKGEWIGKREEGGTKFADCTPSFRDRDKQLDIHFLHLPSSGPP